MCNSYLILEPLRLNLYDRQLGSCVNAKETELSLIVILNGWTSLSEASSVLNVVTVTLLLATLSFGISQQTTLQA